MQNPIVVRRMHVSGSDVYCALHPEQVNMSLIVHDSEAKALVEALHQAFFQDDVLAQVEAENLLVD